MISSVRGLTPSLIVVVNFVIDSSALFSFYVSVFDTRMEFQNGHFYSRVSWHKLESSDFSHTQVFLPSFLISTRCYSRIDSSFLVLRISCSVCIYKTREEYGFL